MLTLHLLLMLVAVNGAPIVCKKILGSRFDRPVDGGRCFFDGRPLFGPSKTWRGLAAATAASIGLGLLLDWPPLWGAAFGGAAMAGDLLSSFLKRRLGVPSSGMALGLDQIPEALFPLLILNGALELELSHVTWIAMTFLVLELGLSQVLFLLRIRDQPH